jgi:hypothetical protein
MEPSKMRTKKKVWKRSKDQCLFFKMVPSMKVNGTQKLIWDMEEDIKFGAMDPFMKDTGSRTKQMVEEG